MTATVAGLLRGAKQLILDHGWEAQAYPTPIVNGVLSQTTIELPRCIRASLADAMVQLHPQPWDKACDNLIHAALASVSTAIYRKPDGPQNTVGGISEYEYAKKRTQQDVIAMLDKAISLATDEANTRQSVKSRQSF